MSGKFKITKTNTDGTISYRCPRCKKYFPKDEFGTWRVYCVECDKAYQRERYLRWKQNNPKTWRRIQLTKRLKKWGGISPEEFDELTKLQRGRCKICKRSVRTLFRDHDHKTEQFRGLICNQCNQGLSRFSDNPHIMRRAAFYLEGKL